MRVTPAEAKAIWADVAAGIAVVAEVGKAENERHHHERIKAQPVLAAAAKPADSADGRADVPDKAPAEETVAVAESKRAAAGEQRRASEKADRGGVVIKDHYSR